MIKVTKMSTGEVKIYADDGVLISENEGELQRLLNTFYLREQKYNMRITVTKTKFIVTSKSAIRSKLAIKQ